MTAVTAPPTTGTTPAAPTRTGTTTTGRQKVTWGGINFVVVALALIPVLWMISLSFKTPTAILDPSFVPAQWTWGNYTQILQTSTFVRPLINSIGIGLIATFIAVVLASMAAYAVARLRFPGKTLLIGMSLLIAMFPIIALVTLLFAIERALGLFNTWPGLIIPYVAFGLPLGIYTLSAFFREIPWELEKAAKMDGATPFQAFTKVIAPLAAPGMVTTAILVFLACWNEFLLAISLTSTTAAGRRQRRWPTSAAARSSRFRPAPSRPPRWSSPSRLSSSRCSSSAGSSLGLTSGAVRWEWIRERQAGLHLVLDQEPSASWMGHWRSTTSAWTSPTVT